MESEQLHERYLAYVDAFNSHDPEGLKGFLDPEIVFEWHGVMPDLVGRDAMLSFYATLWQKIDEHISATILESGVDHLTARIDTTLRIFVDWPDCPIEPYRAGDVHNFSGEISYRFRDGRIISIV